MTSLDLILSEAGRPAPATITADDLKLNYDYSRIEDQEERAILERCAASIYAADRDYRWRVGQALNLAKATIRHGEFMDWVAGEFGPNKWADRTIRDFMAAGRLVEAEPAAAVLPGKVQSLLGSAQNADLAPDVAAALIDQDKAGQGSGRGGRVNETDAKAAINKARGREVYTTDAPPAPSAPAAPKGPRPAGGSAPLPGPAYAGPAVDDGDDLEVFDLANPAEGMAPEIRPADNGAGLVSVSLPYGTAIELANAARGGVLDGFLMFAQVAELISILEVGIDRA